MAERHGDQQAGEIEQVIAQIGLDNLETVLASYRRFVDRVDTGKLMAWQIRDPLDDLLQPLFLAALVTITQDLELGDVGRMLAQVQAGEWEWAVRSDGPRGPRITPLACERDARQLIEESSGFENGRTYTPMRRLIGPWIEAPDVVA